MHLRHLLKTFLIFLAAACIAHARADALAAPAFTITGNSSGSLAQLSVSAALQAAPADVGKNGVIYVAAAVYGAWAFEAANGGWTLWTGGPLPAPYFSGVLGSHSIAIVNQLDLRALPDVKFLVGYGLDAADMIAGQKYNLIAAAPSGSLAGTWVVTSVSGGDNFSVGEILVVGGDGSFVVIDDCYSAGSYVVSGDIFRASVQEFRANSEGNNCSNPQYPVGSIVPIQFSVSGDVAATYLGSTRAVWQRLAPPLGPPTGNWVLTEVNGGDAFSPGDSVFINADGSFTLIGNLTNTGGCTTTGTYSINGNVFTMTPQRSVLPSGGSCRNPPVPGYPIVSAFTSNGSQLTIWHANMVAIGKLVAN